jgi:putative endonuclease
MACGSTTVRGARAEEMAVAHLQGEGYRVVRRNFRAPGGEIDIIAWDGDVLCFVEVRSRDDTVHGDPLETIDTRKIRRVVSAAHTYLDEVPAPWPEMRFDAVGIVLSDPVEIDLVRDAFEANG